MLENNSTHIFMARDELISLAFGVRIFINIAMIYWFIVCINCIIKYFSLKNKNKSSLKKTIILLFFQSFFALSSESLLFLMNGYLQFNLFNYPKKNMSSTCLYILISFCLFKSLWTINIL